MLETGQFSTLEPANARPTSQAFDKSVLARFWSKVAKDRKTGCWLWTGACGHHLYGRLGITTAGRMKMTFAHRISWELHIGPIPAGKRVLHNCPTGDNPRCVNPKHLWLGTPGQNSRDMVAKGRSRAGERNTNAKLTYAKVAAIRRLHGTGELSLSDLAFLFGVCPQLVSRVVRGARWTK